MNSITLFHTCISALLLLYRYLATSTYLSNRVLLTELLPQFRELNNYIPYLDINSVASVPILCEYCSTNHSLILSCLLTQFWEPNNIITYLYFCSVAPLPILSDLQLIYLLVYFFPRLYLNSGSSITILHTFISILLHLHLYLTNTTHLTTRVLLPEVYLNPGSSKILFHSSISTLLLICRYLATSTYLFIRVLLPGLIP